MKNEIDKRYNPANEVMKYQFFIELEHSKEGKDPKTIREYMNAIHEFEVATNFKDFKKYTQDWALDFKNRLSNKKNKQTGDKISKSYYSHYISHTRQFFEWLSKQKDYKHLESKGIDRLYITKNERKQGKATGIQKSYLISEILETIRKMPSNTEIEMRDKAMISLCLLTTPRIKALMTARIGSIQFMREYGSYAFVQSSNLVETKFGNNITAFFISQTQDLIDNVINWQNYLKSKGFKDKDYLFPRIVPSFDKNGISIFQLKKEKIKSTTTIREIFERAFKNNNLDYINPHSFRHTISKAMKRDNNCTRLIPALHENFGHSNGLAHVVSTYGRDYLIEQAELMKNFKFE